MLAISVLSMLEELAAGNQKKLAGNVKDAESLLQPETLNELAQSVPLAAFLAFHPATDQAVMDYVRSGALSADSGPRILVLFALDQTASAPIPVGLQSFSQWLELDTTSHPSYDLVRLLFDERAVPPLPGIVFFASVGDRTDAVYVELAGLNSVVEVQARLRQVFAVADDLVRDGHPGAGFGDDFGTRLKAKRVPYVRTQRASFLEWLVHGFQLIGDHRGDIVAVAGLLI